MKTLLRSTLALVLTLSVRAADAPKPGTQTAQSIEVADDKGGKITLHYWLALPPDSEKKPDAGWPVMFFMHGAGERGDNLDKVKQHGPPKLVGTKPEMNKFIIVSPQCPGGRWWDIVALKGLIDHTLKTQPADKDRVILTGLSMGGYATWGLLAAHPDLAAAAVPSAAEATPPKPPPSNTSPSTATTAAKTPPSPKRRATK